MANYDFAQYPIYTSPGNPANDTIYGPGHTADVMRKTVYGDTLQPTGTSSVTTRTAGKGMIIPEYGDVPDLIIPELDEKRVSELSGKISSPYIRSLRRTTDTALRRHYENPNVAKMVARASLEGFGQSLSNILTSSQTQGRAEAMAELNPKITAAITQYQAELNRKNQIFQASWNNYLNSMTTQTVNKNIYPQSGGEVTGDGESLDVARRRSVSW